MKKKEHRFIVVVKTGSSRKSAEIAILSAFARRNPDYCEFYLLRKKPSQ